MQPTDPTMQPQGEIAPMLEPMEVEEPEAEQPTTLHPEELARISRQIRQDYLSSVTDHQERMKRCDKWRRKFRGIVDPPKKGEEHVSNYEVPILQWVTLAWLARMVEAVLGDESEVFAKPVGDTDSKTTPKVSRYMSWLLRDGMKFMRPGMEWLLKCALYGRAIAFRGWEGRFKKNRDGEPEIVYDGPVCIPMEPEEIMLPADEKAPTVHDASWVMRMVRMSPQELLNGERSGRFFGITEAFGNIVRASRTIQSLENIQMADSAATKTVSDGVEYETPQASTRECLWVFEWYGRWRFPQDIAADVPMDDFERREMDQKDLVVWVIPTLNYKIIGLDALAEMYPIEHLRPFNDLRMLHTGENWPMGLAEMVESHQSESTSLHKLFMSGIRLAATPPGFFRPASGYNPQQTVLEPGLMYPVEGEAPTFMKVDADVQGLIQAMQFVESVVERVTGVNDMTLGRSSERPNAPRTATGQVAMMEQGNARAKLDKTGLAADLSVFLGDIWELTCAIGSEEIFFRVTEEEAGGLFDVTGDKAELNAQERAGRFDFSIQFASSAFSKAAEAERTLQRYQLDLANPLIASNPKALWMVTNAVHKAMGDPDFARVIPEPTAQDIPVDPKTEWVLMQQGDERRPHPLDNDQEHLQRHEQQLMKATEEKGYRDADAEQKLMMHMQAHEAQAAQKMAMQQLVSGLAGALQQVAGAAGQEPQPGGAASPPPGAAPVSSPMSGAPPAPGNPEPQMPAAGEAIQAQMQQLTGAE